MWVRATGCISVCPAYWAHWNCMAQVVTSTGLPPLDHPLASARAPAIRRLRPPGGSCTSATGSGCSRPSSQTSLRSSWRTSRHRRWHGWSGMQSAPGSCVSWSRWDKSRTKQSEGRGGELSGGWAVQGRTDCRLGQQDCNTLPSARIAGAQACAVASAAPSHSRMPPSGSTCCPVHDPTNPTLSALFAAARHAAGCPA